MYLHCKIPLHWAHAFNSLQQCNKVLVFISAPLSFATLSLFPRTMAAPFVSCYPQWFPSPKQPEGRGCFMGILPIIFEYSKEVIWVSFLLPSLLPFCAQIQPPPLTSLLLLFFCFKEKRMGCFLRVPLLNKEHHLGRGFHGMCLFSTDWEFKIYAIWQVVCSYVITACVG